MILFIIAGGNISRFPRILTHTIRIIRVYATAFEHALINEENSK